MRRRALWIVIFALLVTGLPVLGEDGGTKPGIEAAAFMAGHWIGEAGAGLSEEVWTEPEGDSMLGMWRWVQDGKARVYEILALGEDPDHGLVLRLRHFDGALIGWEAKDAPMVMPLIAHAGGELTFEGEENGARVRLTYRRAGPDELVSVLEEKDKTNEFRFRRRGTGD